MKLWTIQHRQILDSLKPRYVASWDFTADNFRPAYRWMVHYLAIHTGIDAVPIWCWHSCNGKRLAGPTVGTAALLIGDWDYFAHQLCVMELNAPESLPLLSSYYFWNELLDESLERKHTPELDSKHLAMFKEPLIKHDGDDIQAVLPYIEDDWVVDVRLLPETDDQWDREI